MAEYMPLTELDGGDDYELEVKASRKSSHHSNFFNVENPTTLAWLAIFMVVMAISTAAALHASIFSATSRLEPIRSPNDVISTLQMKQPYTNLQKGIDIINQKGMKKRPKMRFPKFMVRANAAEPDKFYHSGASIVLSPSDSMFYHWKIRSAWPRCYVSGWVSPLKELVASNKSYIAEGDITAIEVWNVTSPIDPQSLKTMSWNTRPKRLSLMGTVNFTDREVQNRIVDLTGKELKMPTPLFDCSNKMNLTVEIACKSCRLQFDQLFTDPPLGFEVIDLA